MKTDAQKPQRPVNRVFCLTQLVYWGAALNMLDIVHAESPTLWQQRRKMLSMSQPSDEHQFFMPLSCV